MDVIIECIPKEILLIIASSCTSIRDIINFSRACNSFNKTLSDELLPMMSTINKKRPFPIWNKHHDNIFRKYRRGKCYDLPETSQSYDGDIPFVLSEYEQILCCINVKMRQDDGILTITVRPRDDSFNFLLFCPVVWSNDEYTPDYWGWDPHVDPYVYKLLVELTVSNICDIKNCLSEYYSKNYQYEAKAYRDARPDCIKEDTTQLMKKIIDDILS